MTSTPAWIANRPRNWRAVPFRYLYRRTKRVGYENETLLSVYRDHGVVDKSSRSDNFNNASEDLGLYQLVNVGDLAINKMKAWQGSVAVSPIRGIVSPAYFVYTPTHHEHSGYLHYLFRSAEYTRLYQLYSKGIRVNQWDLDPSVHGSMPVLLPPVEEQRRIAEFLDRETAQIDELIAKQEQLISTLAERLSAEIHAAVTAGMEPVGTVQLRHVALVLDCKHITAEFVEEGYPLVSIGETRDEFIDLENAKRTTKEYFDLLREGGRDPRPGDLIFTRNATVGNVSRVGDFTETFALGQDVCLIRPSGQELNAAFLQAQLLGPLIRSQLDGFMVGSTFKRVNVQQVRSLRLVVPDLSIQEEVVAQVRRKRVETETLIARTQSVIGLLRERRQALISAAVTGQIDAGGAS